MVMIIPMMMMRMMNHSWSPFMLQKVWWHHLSIYRSIYHVVTCLVIIIDSALIVVYTNPSNWWWWWWWWWCWFIFHHSIDHRIGDLTTDFDDDNNDDDYDQKVVTDDKDNHGVDGYGSVGQIIIRWYWCFWSRYGCYGLFLPTIITVHGGDRGEGKRWDEEECRGWWWCCE